MSFSICQMQNQKSVWISKYTYITCEHFWRHLPLFVYKNDLNLHLGRKKHGKAYLWLLFRVDNIFSSEILIYLL